MQFITGAIKAIFRKIMADQFGIIGGASPDQVGRQETFKFGVHDKEQNQSWDELVYADDGGKARARVRAMFPEPRYRIVVKF